MAGVNGAKDYVIDGDCCDDPVDTSKYHPRKDRQHYRHKPKAFNFSQLANPLPGQVKDPQEILDMFKKWPLIPYAGNRMESQQGLLYWFQSMTKLSPTLGSCISSIRSFSFGSKLKVVKITDPNFDIDDEEGEDEVSKQTKTSFSNFLSENIDLGSETWTTAVREIFLDWKESGNYYIQLTLTETLGVKSATMKIHTPENCLYWATLEGEPRVILISPYWTFDYLEQNPPTAIAAWPNWTENEDTKTTIIHVKNSGEWYGRPDWMNAFMYAYREFQDANYLIKQSANNFVGQVLIEVEDDDPESGSILDQQAAVDAGFDSVAQRVEENFTAKGDNPQSVLLLSRPYGSKAAFVFQFKPNTNENFYDVNAQINESKIVAANLWAKKLLGLSLTTGQATNSLMEELRSRSVTVIPELQMKIAYGLNLVIAAVVEHVGAAEFKNMGIGFYTPIEILIQQLAEEAERLKTDFKIGDFPEAENAKKTQDGKVDSEPMEE